MGKAKRLKDITDVDELWNLYYSLEGMKDEVLERIRELLEAKE